MAAAYGRNARAWRREAAPRSRAFSSRRPEVDADSIARATQIQMFFLLCSNHGTLCAASKCTHTLVLAEVHTLCMPTSTWQGSPAPAARCYL